MHESRDIVTATQGRRWVEVLYGCSEGQVSYEEDALGHGVFIRWGCRGFEIVRVNDSAGFSVKYEQASGRRWVHGSVAACIVIVGC